MGAAGEIVGALAVVVTLIYLSVQLRQNTRSSELVATQAFFSATAAVNRDRGKLQDGLLRRGLADWHCMPADDQARLDAYLCDFASQIHMGYRLYRREILDEESYISWEAALVAILNEKGGAAWWETASKIWPHDFNERLAAQLEQTDLKWTEMMPWYRSDA